MKRICKFLFIVADFCIYLSAQTNSPQKLRDAGQNTNSMQVVISESLLPDGDYEMGDHFQFVDPMHGSDEIPIHKVKISSLSMAKTETTNRQFLDFLNSSAQQSLIEVRNNAVYAIGGTDAYFYSHQYGSNYSIDYDGKLFSVLDFRANHPVVGVMWCGAAAYCNWLSLQNGLQPCYNPLTWVCDFIKNGYRLPTEAE